MRRKSACSKATFTSRIVCSLAVWHRNTTQNVEVLPEILYLAGKEVVGILRRLLACASFAVHGLDYRGSDTHGPLLFGCHRSRLPWGLSIQPCSQCWHGSRSESMPSP